MKAWLQHLLHHIAGKECSHGQELGIDLAMEVDKDGWPFLGRVTDSIFLVLLSASLPVSLAVLELLATVCEKSASPLTAKTAKKAKEANQLRHLRKLRELIS